MNTFLIVVLVTQVGLFIAIGYVCAAVGRAKRKQRELDRYIGGMSAGVQAIEVERRRQIEEEGWTAEHDDREHANGELAMAAVCYAMRLREQEPGFVANVRRNFWPWAKGWWKPSTDRVRNLEKAGALIAAEIDRLKRAEARAATTQPAVAEFNAETQRTQRRAEGNHENCNVPKLHHPFCQCAAESKGGAA